MTAKDLISALSELPPETEVSVWIDGERYAISKSTPVDPWDENFADINATAENEEA